MASRVSYKVENEVPITIICGNSSCIVCKNNPNGKCRVRLFPIACKQEHQCPNCLDFYRIKKGRKHKNYIVNEANFNKLPASNFTDQKHFASCIAAGNSIEKKKKNEQQQQQFNTKKANVSKSTKFPICSTTTSAIDSSSFNNNNIKEEEEPSKLKNTKKSQPFSSLTSLQPTRILPIRTTIVPTPLLDSIKNHKRNTKKSLGKNEDKIVVDDDNIDQKFSSSFCSLKNEAFNDQDSFCFMNVNNKREEREEEENFFDMDSSMKPWKRLKFEEEEAIEKFNNDQNDDFLMVPWLSFNEDDNNEINPITEVMAEWTAPSPTNDSNFEFNDGNVNEDDEKKMMIEIDDSLFFNNSTIATNVTDDVAMYAEDELLNDPKLLDYF